ncbi:YbaB/EbfC family nucleoid-associated protein [Mycobacterium sp. URHB0021]
MTLTDDQYVAQAEAALAHMRARNKAFLDAVDGIDIPSLHDAVRARFDSNGELVDLDIAPEALSTYTNVELEQLIADVLRETRNQLTDQMHSLFVKYLVPTDPRFDPDVTGERYVAPPRPDA